MGSRHAPTEPDDLCTDRRSPLQIVDDDDIASQSLNGNSAQLLLSPLLLLLLPSKVAFPCVDTSQHNRLSL
jgi:hypothetical protein